MRSDRALLIVEDDKMIRETLGLALEFEGYRVATAPHGREALEQLQGGLRPGLILLDLMMPIMNGWQFVETISQNRELASIPIVLITAFPERAGGMPVKEVLKKPVGLDRLFSMVRQYCGTPPESELRTAG